MPSFQSSMVGAPTQQTSMVGSGGGRGNYYQDALNFQMGNYNQILNEYGATRNMLQNQLGSISQGYGQLYQGIRDTLGLGGNGWGVATPAANAISEQFAKSRGKITQGMINSGLGNSTVTANLQNQNSLMAARAYGELGNQLAGTAAGYASQIGQAQLGAAQQGLGMQANYSSGFMGDLSHFQLPNPGGYGGGGSGGGGGGSRGGGGGGSGSSGMQNAFGWADNLIGAGGRDSYTGGAGGYQMPSWGGEYSGGGNMGGSFTPSGGGGSTGLDNYDSYGGDSNYGYNYDPYDASEWTYE